MNVLVEKDQLTDGHLLPLMSKTPPDPKILENMERETGIEPATSSLGSWRSTAELLPLTAKMARIF